MDLCGKMRFINSVFIIILLISSITSAVDVKFSVDLTDQINSGVFNPSSHKVYLRGNFNNWELTIQMQRQTSGNIYTSIVQLEGNKTYYYKYFINSSGAPNNGYESNTVGVDRNGDRHFSIGLNNVDLAVMHFDNSNMALRKETEHFLIYCDPKDENILNDYSARLEDSYRRITLNLETAIGSKIHVQIFKDLKTLHTASGYPEDNDWAVGSAIGKTVIISVSPNYFNESPSTTGLLSVIAHEFVHIAEAWKSTINLHILVNEGTAMYLSDFPFVRSTTEVREFIKELGYKPTFAYFETNFANHGYAFAGTVTDFIVTKHGMRGLANYIGNAVPTTLGYASFEEFQSAWHNFLEQYYMPTENLITKDKAEVIAKNWYKHWNPDLSASDKISAYSLVEIYNIPQIHVFNFESDGFVLVAATDRVKPIIGYNFSSSAPEFTFFYRDLFVSHMDDIQTPETITQWTNIFNNDFSSYSHKYVTPLLTTHWHQWWPYNAYYPKNPTFFFEENGYYRISCGPAAAAQVTKYWNHPEKPRSFVKIKDPVWGTYTVNYDTVKAFDWKNMPDFLPVDPNLPKSNYDASAYMIYNLVLGTIHMPGAGGGGSVSNWAGVWATYFDYSFNTNVIQAENHSYNEWKNFFDEELDNGRPVLMSGSTDMEGMGGHYFILDGYQADDYYHVNLGWAHINGYLDGYYPLDNPGGFRFKRLAVTGLEPNKKNISVGGPYQNDEHTAALFHFNGNLNNSSSLSGNAVQYGSGVSFSVNDSLDLGECLRINNSTADKKSYIKIPHNDNLSLNGNWTIETWFYINSWGIGQTSYPCLLSKSASQTGDPNYEIYFNAVNKNLEARYRDNSPWGKTTVFTNDSTIELHKWYHIAYIRDSHTNNIKVILHNRKKELVYYWTIPYSKFTEANPRLSTNDLFIGWFGNYDNTYFDGYIDELRISNVVRDFQSAEVSYVNSYPGDADDDGIVKAADVLPLGIYYGKTGGPREEAAQGCGWTMFNRLPWDTYRATSADCNGDGVVDAADILCIGYNYNKTAVTYKPGKLNKTLVKKSEENPLLSLIYTQAENELEVKLELSNVKALLGISFNLSWDRDILELKDEENVSQGEIWSKDALFINKLFNEKALCEFGITNRAGNFVKDDGTAIKLKAIFKAPGSSGFKVTDAYWIDDTGEKFELSLSSELTSVNEDNIIKHYSLVNYPNPFNPSTNIRFTLPVPQKVKLRIFNIIGAEVAVLLNDEVVDQGEHELTWNAAGMASGIYFCRMETSDKTLTRKLMVIK